jgi:hypothetical protein
MIFEIDCAVAMLVRASCGQHCLSLTRTSHPEAKLRHEPKCRITGRMKLKIVMKTTVPCTAGVESVAVLGVKHFGLAGRDGGGTHPYDSLVGRREVENQQIRADGQLDDEDAVDVQHLACKRELVLVRHLGFRVVCPEGVAEEAARAVEAAYDCDGDARIAHSLVGYVSVGLLVVDGAQVRGRRTAPTIISQSLGPVRRDL